MVGPQLFVHAAEADEQAHSQQDHSLQRVSSWHRTRPRSERSNAPRSNVNIRIG